MVDVIAEQGYEAATVRRLAQRAGVSTRTFYQHYSGKEECFLRTQGLIERRWSERVVASQETDGSEETPLCLGAAALLQAWVEWPVAARFMLVDAWTGGPGTLTRSRNAIRMIAAKCSNSDVYSSSTARVFTEGVFAGLAAVVRSQLINGQSIDIQNELMEWVDSCFSLAASEAFTLGPPRQVSSSNVEIEDALSPKGDRALLLSAVSKLAEREQAEALTPKRISEVAGLSQRKFHSVFSSLDDCVVAAVEWRTSKAISLVSQHRNSSASQLNDAYRSASQLCVQISRDAALTNLCFGQVGQTSALQLHGQERMAEMIGFLIHGEPARIAAEASAFSVLDVLHSEVTSSQTGRLGEAVPALTYLLLAPAIKTSKVIEAIDQQNHMAAA